MSTLKKTHILGAGSAALLGGVVGGGLGWGIGGPPGLAIGAAAGGALGAVWGNRASEARDTRDDLGHFEQIYHTMPYYVDGHDWHDYAPAYRYGLDTHAQHHGRRLDEVETQLQGGWERAARFGSRLQWTQARPAVAHAWTLLDEAQGRSASAADVPG